MKSKSSKKRMLVYGGAGTVISLCIVGLILLFGIPGCGDDDDSNKVTDPGDSLFNEINQILRELVGPAETALRENLPACYGNGARIGGTCYPGGSGHDDYVYYKHKSWEYEVYMEYVDNTNDVLVKTLAAAPGPGGVTLTASVNIPQGALQAYIYIGECFTADKCGKIWANDTACCSCPDSGGYDLDLSMLVKCFEGEFQPIVENNVELSISPDIKVTESIGKISFDVKNLTDEVSSALKSLIVSELNKKIIPIPSVINGIPVPPAWQGKHSLPEIMNMCGVLVPDLITEVCPKTGYSILSADGGINCLGNAAYYGHGCGPGSNKTDLGVTPTGKGYWILSSEGVICSFGDAEFYGNAVGLSPLAWATAIGVTPTGKGYWILSSEGVIYSLGDAVPYGASCGGDLGNKVWAIDLGVTPTGKGYWILRSDGGICSFGDAEFYGNALGLLGLAWATAIGVTPTGKGYWILSSEGGIYSFGDAVFHGFGCADSFLAAADLGVTPTGKGYWILTENGGICSFGDAEYYGNALGLLDTAVAIGVPPASP